MTAASATGRLSPALRTDSRVSPLELFFDLVFVLALTQCTALMAERGSWIGIGEGLLVLVVLWWSWSGYAWLTSTVDPESGLARLVVFVAMAAFLVVALCVPEAFGEATGLFVAAYAAVRIAHLALFVVASKDSPALRQSVLFLTASSTLGVGVLAIAAATDGTVQYLLWGVAIVFDLGGPLLFGVEGWRIVPGHFAERFGLVTIIAIGESVVAIGAGLDGAVTGPVVVAAVLGTAVAAALWWLYFDVVALVAERRLVEAAPGGEQNRIARDSYAFLHLPMVAGIVLVALGLKKTLGDVGSPLTPVAATALLGGAATYLLAHVAFRYRNVHTLSRTRTTAAALCLALIPATRDLPSLGTLALLAGILTGLIGFEALHYADARHAIRAQAHRS